MTIQKMVVDKAPKQFKLPFALWTRDALRLAIKKLYGVDIPLRTISDYLKRWGVLHKNLSEELMSIIPRSYGSRLDRNTLTLRPVQERGCRDTLE